MFFFVTGNLLESKAEALVNTVNCEGYMGKGIAYQFRMKFPKNNDDYVKACKDGLLYPGILHFFREQGKLIINFPTKIKWRQKSHMSYIELGLDALADLIEEEEIKSIAIPPLGSGNGGLVWNEVEPLIISKLEPVASRADIYVYRPSKNYIAKPLREPKLSSSALVLMEIKQNLNHFDSFRLQKTAYFMDLLVGKHFFKFQAYIKGPYCHAIDVISTKIREFQLYYNTSSTEEAKNILYGKLVSESVNNKMQSLMPHIINACKLVNSIKSDHDLECMATICYLLETNGTDMDESDLIDGFQKWSDRKASIFSVEDIERSVTHLIDLGVIQKTILGYKLLA